MTFLCNVIIRVSFEMSFPHLYVLEVWQSQIRLCYKSNIFLLGAHYFLCFQYTFSPAENNFSDVSQCKSWRTQVDESLCNLCHYRQNVPQHYYCLDTFSLVVLHNLMWKESCGKIGSWWSSMSLSKQVYVEVLNNKLVITSSFS